MSIAGRASALLGSCSSGWRHGRRTVVILGTARAVCAVITGCARGAYRCMLLPSGQAAALTESPEYAKPRWRAFVISPSFPCVWFLLSCAGPETLQGAAPLPPTTPSAAYFAACGADLITRQRVRGADHGDQMFAPMLEALTTQNCRIASRLIYETSEKSATDSRRLERAAGLACRYSSSSTGSFPISLEDADSSA